MTLLGRLLDRARRSRTRCCCATCRTATGSSSTCSSATFLGDTGAYFGGRAFGTRQLAPTISPNKTVEGLLIGDRRRRSLAVWFAGLYQDWLQRRRRAAARPRASRVAAPIGDLFESYVKRDAGTKDTGRLFGAHGGALDRLDAVLFAVVAGYYVWQAML